MHEDRLGADLLESSSTDKDLGVLVSLQGILGVKHCQQVKGGDPIPLLSPGRPGNLSVCISI